MSRQQDRLGGDGQGGLRTQVERAGEPEVPTVLILREGFESGGYDHGRRGEECEAGVWASAEVFGGDHWSAGEGGGAAQYSGTG